MTPRLADSRSPALDVPRTGFQWWWIVVALAAVLVVVPVAHITAGPATVARVTFVNHGPYDLDVDVRASANDGRLPLVTVPANGTVDVQDVVDLGSTWIAHFTGQGIDGGDVVLSRDALTASGWRFDIPQQVVDRLHDAGAPPSPSRPST